MKASTDAPGPRPLPLSRVPGLPIIGWVDTARDGSPLAAAEAIVRREGWLWVIQKRGAHPAAPITQRLSGAGGPLVNQADVARAEASKQRLSGAGGRRIERHIKELFVFVAEPDVPADNNPAERSLRHLVSAARLAAAPARSRAPRARSIFGTWPLQNHGWASLSWSGGPVHSTVV